MTIDATTGTTVNLLLPNGMRVSGQVVNPIERVVHPINPVFQKMVRDAE